jgi:hypothetical protein
MLWKNKYLAETIWEVMEYLPGRFIIMYEFFLKEKVDNQIEGFKFTQTVN